MLQYSHCLTSARASFPTGRKQCRETSSGLAHRHLSEVSANIDYCAVAAAADNQKTSRAKLAGCKGRRSGTGLYSPCGVPRPAQSKVPVTHLAKPTLLGQAQQRPLSSTLRHARISFVGQSSSNWSLTTCNDVRHYNLPRRSVPAFVTAESPQLKGRRFGRG